MVLTRFERWVSFEEGFGAVGEEMRLGLGFGWAEDSRGRLVLD